MIRIPTLAAALLLTACADPQHAWQPTEPSFGRDQAVTQQAFCCAIFASLSRVAEDPDDQATLLHLAAATETRIAKLGAAPGDVAVADGLRHAAIYALGATADQIAAAAEICGEVVAMGESR